MEANPKQLTDPGGTPVILLGAVFEELFTGLLLQPLGTLSHHRLLHLGHIVLHLHRKKKKKKHTQPSPREHRESSSGRRLTGESRMNWV